jgi:GntR family transcriptional repressor for pyruvate dehydrogenase complex
MTKQNNLLIPLSKTRLHEGIMEQLKDKILRRELLPGDKLPPERELADQLNVNRTTVREALHKLESIGLVEIKHGNGVFVKDYRESSSLELAKQILFLDGRLNLDILKNLLDLRKLIVPEMCYFAALNRSDQDLQDLEHIVFHNNDMPIDERDWRVHNIIARASGNLLYAILLNSFTSLIEDSSYLYFDNKENQKRSAKFHRDIFKAITQQDGDKARRIMLDVMVFAEEKTYKAVVEAERKGGNQLT